MRFKFILAVIVVLFGSFFIWQGMQPQAPAPASPTMYHRDATEQEKQVHDIHSNLDLIRACKKAPTAPQCSTLNK